MYEIEYSNIPHVSFPSASGTKKYLQEEAEIWAPVLGLIKDNAQLENIPLAGGSTSAQALATSFDRLLDRLDDPKSFNLGTQRYRGDITLPPPSSSIEGQLILGLHENGRNADAACSYIWFISQSLEFNQNSNRHVTRMITRGEQLFTAAYAAAALPFGRVTSRRLSGATRTAEGHVKSLSQEVEKAEKINAEHEEELLQARERFKTRAKRLEAWSIRRERSRNKRHERWIEQTDSEVKDRFTRAEKRLEAIEKVNETKQKSRQEEFDRLLDLFHTQLRFKAPAGLWADRAEIHGRKSKTAFRWFVFLSCLAVAAAALIPYCFGDYIAESFFTQVCDGASPPVCTREFSAKGPLTLAGVLVIMSLIMWAIRLQFRVHLSERHLSLDASEKQAFAESYLAMKEGEDVGVGNEAIVLASLFRPTQDGIINDDGNTLDLSAVAILAKQLGR